MNDFVIGILQSYPWIVWVWLGASVVAIGLRAAYNDSADRPRLVVAILAVIDFLQLNFSGPAKLISTQVKVGKNP